MTRERRERGRVDCRGGCCRYGRECIRCRSFLEARLHNTGRELLTGVRRASQLSRVGKLHHNLHASLALYDHCANARVFQRETQLSSIL